MSIVTQSAQTLSKGQTMQTIQIEIKRVYGNVVAYPICDKAKLFASIAGTSTLTAATLKRIQSLGYSFICKTYDINEVLA
jgi:hypothetical protein